VVRLAGLTELDFHLITALQVEPRADWQRIGHALGVTAATAVRRWARLAEEGAAWLSSHPMRIPDVAPVVAIIEVDCLSGHVHAVAEQITDDSHVFAVNIVTGSRDLLCIAAFTDHDSLARYLGFRLGSLPGVKAARCHLAGTIHCEGSRWRLERLDAQRRESLRRNRPDPARARSPDAADMSIMGALGEDCRRPLAELADITNLSPSTVNRRLARLEADRSVVYRCDLARGSFGWPVEMILWANVPAEQLPHVAAQLVGMREIRFCATLTGPSNLILFAWLRSTADTSELEGRIRRHLPDFLVTDRAVTLWSLKLAGNVLDPQGRFVRRIPIAAWQEQQVTTP
jgi:DNA-binding Lrp family transcriptional regulator